MTKQRSSFVRHSDRPAYTDEILDGMAAANGVRARRQFANDERAADTETPSGDQAGPWHRSPSQSVLLVLEEKLALLEEAANSVGWWDWDVGDDRLFASPDLARTFGVDPVDARDGITVRAFLQAIHEADRPRIQAAIEQAMQSGEDYAEEYRVVNLEGQIRWIRAQARCYRDSLGRPRRFPGVAIDITERRQSGLRKQALADLGEHLRHLRDVEAIALAAARVMAEPLNAVRAGFGIVDSVKETVYVPADWTADGIASVSGLHHFRDYGSYIDDLKSGRAVIIGDVRDDDRTSANADALASIDIAGLVNLPIVENGRLALVVLVHHRLPHDYSDAEINFIRTIANQAQSAIARIRADQERELLNAELSHRMKNTLTMVQSIVNQTLRNTADPDAAKAAIAMRIDALSRAHDVLLSGNVGETAMATILAKVLEPHLGGTDRYLIDGPAIELSSSAALSLSLVIHELATNATKYGALSVPGGRVRIAWRIEEREDDAHRFVLDWSEHGGPTVSEPQNVGFGSRLIRAGIAGRVDGYVSVDWHPDGMRCRMDAPLANVTTHHEPDGTIVD